MRARLEEWEDGARVQAAGAAIPGIVGGKLAIAKRGHDDYDFAGAQLQ